MFVVLLGTVNEYGLIEVNLSFAIDFSTVKISHYLAICNFEFSQ